MATCPTCNGRKQVLRSKECEVCERTGEVDGERCQTCNGTGYVVYPVDCSTCGGSGEVDDDSNDDDE